MAISGGPDIVEDGLVLHLDAAEPLCFRGEPTVNLISDPLALTSNPIPSIYESTNTRTSTLPSTNMASISPFWIKCEKTSSSNGRTAAIGVLPLTAGVDYCISYYVYSNDNRLTNLSWNTDNASVSSVVSRTYYTSNDLNNIKRVQTVFRSTSGSNSMILRVNSTDPIGTTFYLTGLQVEQKSYPTNIVYGTRGSTVATGGGLLDLTNNGNNGTINRTSVPSAAFYNGNNGGSFVFDGSNDYINCGQSSSLLFGTGSFSVSQWFYVSTGNILKTTASRFSGSGWWLALDNRYNSNTEGIGFAVSSSAYNSSYHARGTTSNFKYNINQWNNLVAVWDGVNKNILIYLNNTLTTTTQTQNGGGGLAGVTNTDSNTNNIIGAYTNGSSYNFPGKISQTIIYNKVLSANEVQQNYNATKGRYGL